MRPRSKLTAAFLGLFAIANFADAQDTLKGTYHGHYEGNINPQTTRSLIVGVELLIASVENGNASGLLTLQGGSCRGKYAFEGATQDGRLDLLTASGEVRGCGQTTVVLSLDRGKLSGNFGTSAIELSKVR
jgi:hypothetical protein